MSPSLRTKTALCILLTLLTWWVYRGVIDSGFLNYDDPQYVTGNGHATSGLSAANVVWAFTSGYAANWHPLTWLSHMADVELFGLDPRGHHLVNLLFHNANACLLFLVLAGLTGATFRSAVVAALFAIHPLHMESVAWIAERKDLLSTFLGMLTLLAYTRYVRGGGRRWYGATCGCYGLCLMAKPMLVTLPLVMLLLDYWPLQRFESAPASGNCAPKPPLLRSHLGAPLFVEKLPLFILAALSCGITLHVQRAAINSFTDTPFLLRITNAPVAYLRYLEKAVWPHDLSIIYPLPFSIPVREASLAVTILLAITYGAWRGRGSRPYLLVGWLWFLGTLIPVIGIVQVGLQAMADRYTYVPLVGIFVMAVWGGADLAVRWPSLRIPLVAGAAGLIFAYGTVARGYGRCWRDSATLFAHAVAVTSGNGYAEYLLGDALYRERRFPEALAHYAKALQLQPRLARAHVNMGVIFAEEGAVPEAVSHFVSALVLDPASKEAHYNLAVALQGEGKAEEAMAQYREVLRIDPADVMSRNNLGVALMRLGSCREATGQFTEALRIDPGFREARLNLRLCQEREGTR